MEQTKRMIFSATTQMKGYRFSLDYTGQYKYVVSVFMHDLNSNLLIAQLTDAIHEDVVSVGYFLPTLPVWQAFGFPLFPPNVTSLAIYRELSS